MEDIGNQMWGVVVLVLIGIFRAKLEYAWFCYTMFANRKYDLDGDPRTPNSFEGLSGATGEWGAASVIYRFWCKPSRWGAIVTHADGGIEEFTYRAFDAWRTREPKPYKRSHKKALKRKAVKKVSK